MRINIDTLSDLTDYASGFKKISLFLSETSPKILFSSSFVIIFLCLQLPQKSIQEEQAQNLAF